MASTADCKQLLEQDPRLAGQADGGWKRLGKRKVDGGQARVFSNGSSTLYALVLETASGLSIEKVADSLDALDAPQGMGATLDSAAKPVAKEPEGRVTVDLFSLFPPPQRHANHMSGRLVYTPQAEDPFYGPKTLIFEMGYETREGYLYDQYASSYERLLTAMLPEYENQLSCNDSEGRHSIELEDDDTHENATLILSERLERFGIVRQGMGRPGAPYTGRSVVELDSRDPTWLRLKKAAGARGRQVQVVPLAGIPDAPIDEHGGIFGSRPASSLPKR